MQAHPNDTHPETFPPLVAEAGSRLLTAAEQEAFEALSLEVFGASSRWATILKKGMAQPVLETITEYIPAVLNEDGTVAKAEETKEKKVPIYLDQAKKSLKLVNKYFTPEELLGFMQERKKQIDAIKAMIQKQQDDAAAKKAQAEIAKHVAENVSGSAV